MQAPRSSDARVERVIEFYESLRPQDLQRLPQLYHEDAGFKDPFNEVKGLDAIQAVFEHMFRTLDEPRFVVHDVIVEGEQCFLGWDFFFRMRRFARHVQCIRGGTQLGFAPDGRIQMHRDRWDAAEELYEKLPLLGGLMRWLKRRARA